MHWPWVQEEVLSVSITIMQINYYYTALCPALKLYFSCLLCDFTLLAVSTTPLFFILMSKYGRQLHNIIESNQLPIHVIESIPGWL